MVSGLKRKPGAKTPSYFSHEFIIQNHGDIVTCIFMVFIVGLMFQITAPLASVFVTLKYNITELDYSKPPILYTYGLKDIAVVLYYSLSAVIFHAIIQEYILDKMIRRVRLSKTKTSKFNESGQLLAFYIVSIIWSINIFKEEGYFQSLSFFWSGYPHVGITFWTKMFFIIQMSYWIHTFPELYFQKVKKEEITQKITIALVYLFITASIYLLNLSRIGLTLLFIDYLINLVFHASRIVYFSGKLRAARISFKLFNFLFVIGRLASSILTIFVFWFGLESSNVEKIDFEHRNYNTKLTRLTCLVVALSLQAYLMWIFIMFQFKKRRENTKTVSSSKLTSVNKSKLTKKIKSTSSRETSDNEGEVKYDSDSQNESSSNNGKVKAN